MTRLDLGVDIIPVIGTIADEGHHGTIKPAEQGTDLRAIVGVPPGQHRGDDLAGVGVRRKVEHLPGPAPLAAMLLVQPVTRTAQP